MLRRRVFFPWAFTLLAPGCLFAQEIVSAHSGIVHFFEGIVTLDGQPLEPKFGKFYEIKPGSELQTGQGRAEVLLTAGVLLRLDQHSAIRMLSDRLTDTRLELLNGAAALQSAQDASSAPVTIGYKNFQMRFSKPGQYRIDSEPAELRVQQGEAEVVLSGKAVHVASEQVVPLAVPLVAQADNQRPEDDLDHWADSRNAEIAQQDASAASSDNLSSALNNAPAGGAIDPGAAGGYGTSGVYVPLTPDPYYYGGYYSPYGSPFYSPYMSPFYRYSYPVVIGVPVYRSAPLRTPNYGAPGRSYTPPRPAPPAPPRVPPHLGPRPGIRR